MHDWKKFVQERMNTTSLAPEQREEIVREIAAHLEDVFEAARSEGFTEVEALKRATSEEVDWRRLTAQIQRTKQREGIMNDRTKKFWLPGFISLASASIFLMILAKISYEPRVILLRSSLMILVYPIWLAAQPAFGALGAYFSRRGGGTVWVRLAAGLFPSLVLFAGICIALLVRGLQSGPYDWGTGGSDAVIKSMIGGILIPSVGLLAGAIPFLREAKTQALARN